MDDANADLAKFPCAIEITVPFPTPRLSATALRALQVDPELSPLVRRTLSLSSRYPEGEGEGGDRDCDGSVTAEAYLLNVRYRATTNRMLRVAVNSFMEGLKLVVEVMEQLDVDVLADGAAASKGSDGIEQDGES